MIRTMQKYVPAGQRHGAVSYLMPLYRTVNGFVCSVLYVDSVNEGRVTLSEKEINIHFVLKTEASKWPGVKRTR